MINKKCLKVLIESIADRDPNKALNYLMIIGEKLVSTNTRILMTFVDESNDSSKRGVISKALLENALRMKGAAYFQLSPGEIVIYSGEQDEICKFTEKSPEGLNLNDYTSVLVESEESKKQFFTSREMAIGYIIVSGLRPACKVPSVNEGHIWSEKDVAQISGSDEFAGLRGALLTIPDLTKEM